MARELHEVLYVDGVRTAFGKAGPGGIFWKTRADDMGVKVVRELMRRNPQAPPDRIGDVVMAATAQVGDQGLTPGRDVGLLAGLIGVPLGLIAQRAVLSYMGEVAAHTGIPPSVYDVFTPLALLGLASLGLVIGAIGAYLPAQRAALARIAPVLQAE